MASSSVDNATFLTTLETYEMLPAPAGAPDEAEDGVGDGTDDNLQGPHNWRKLLSPVRTLSPSSTMTMALVDDVTLALTVTADGTNKFFDTNGVSTPPNEAVTERVPRERRLSRDERLEEGRIRERLKAMPWWRKDLVEKKQRGPMIVKHLSSSMSSINSDTTSPCTLKRRAAMSSGPESPFARQVVNKSSSPGSIRRRPSNSISCSARINLFAAEKKQCFGSNSSLVGRRPASPNNPAEGAVNSAEVMQRRVAKVQKARLYLLQQMGPNSFMVGGDSPDHKYRVIIGPQRCSCGRSPHCVHLLFVMLRVFQVPETDARLWSRTLKNYEVESLFRNFHTRRTLRISVPGKGNKSERKPQMENDRGQDGGTEEPALTNNCNSDAEETAKDEEETCPICLLEMVEGESLTECVEGCQNKYHHHCVAVWFQECQRQNEPLICPLCRCNWKLEEGLYRVASREELQVPPNTRASSPLSAPSDAEVLMQNAEPIPIEHRALAEPWISVLNEELVSCLFSKNWSVREIALKQLGELAKGSLLLGLGEGLTGAVLSPTRTEATHCILECACRVLAYMCADPVYKVFVAALRELRTLLSYTPCRNDEQQTRLQSLMQPVVNTILWKCADSNKRTSQLSISALQELVKGRDGELAIGSEIVNPGTLGIGGLSYILRCINTTPPEDGSQWQWLLGRLYVLDKFIEEYPDEFVISSRRDDSGDTTDKRYNNRVMAILNFIKPFLQHSHAKVARMARRVFYVLSKMQVHETEVFREIINLLNDLQTMIQVHMKRKLVCIAEDNYRVQRVQLDDGGHAMDGDEQMFLTPSTSTCSTPRSSSPVSVTLSPQQSLSVPKSASQSVMPIVPPNSPNHRKMKTKLRRWRVSSQHESLSTNTARDRVSGVRHRSPPLYRSRRPVSTESIDLTDGVDDSTSGCSGNDSELKLPPSDSDRNHVDASSVDIPEGGARSKSEQDANTCDKIGELDSSRDSDEAGACSLPVVPSTSQPTRPVDFGSDFAFGGACGQDRQAAVMPGRSVPCLVERPLFSPIAEECSADEESSYSASSINANASSSPAMLTEDLSDLTLSPSGPEDNDVSFKTEVAFSHEDSPKHRDHPATSCHCKEEVELEEAKALVAALEQSSAHQSTLPFVPGLSQVNRDEELIIHLQNEEPSGDGQAPNRYLEGEDWIRGFMIGTGAFSTCYQARDVKTGTLMAVKQIPFCRNTISEQRKVVEAIEEEIQMMAKLNHPNIVRILGATRQTCHFFMFVEWMPGGSVSSLLDMYGRFNDSVITKYTLQVLLGLAHLHENHILHRDLKGANLLVDSTGQRLRIGDFGAAARLASRMTGAGEFQGQLLGTIAFMAPEVLQGSSYGRSCDMWGVGCTMIEMASTKAPWAANEMSNHLALIYKIASTTNPPPIPDHVCPAIRDVMLRCLDCNSKERPSAKELLKHPLFTMSGQ